VATDKDPVSHEAVDPGPGAPEASGPAVRFEPVLPLMLAALGLVAVVFVGGGPAALGLVLLTGLLGTAGFAGWQGCGPCCSPASG